MKVLRNFDLAAKNEVIITNENKGSVVNKIERF